MTRNKKRKVRQSKLYFERRHDVYCPVMPETIIGAWACSKCVHFEKHYGDAITCKFSKKIKEYLSN